MVLILRENAMKVKEMEIFWGRIKRLIKKKNMTQEEAAKASGIHLHTLQGWMAKGIYPSIIDTYHLAKVLGVSIEYLMVGKDIHEKEIETRLKNIRQLLDKASSGLDDLI
jgi:transcriptional regulator with XRE-family HTH domain